MKRLAEKIKDKTVCIALHGKSLQELEDKIGDFNNNSICWASLNAFDIVDEYILSKVYRKLDIIYCGAEYFPEIEQEIRIPLLVMALDRGAFVVGKEFLFTETFPNNGVSGLHETYAENILLLENIPGFMELMLQYTVSSFAFLLCVLSIAGAKNIILFGCDGIGPEVTDYLGTYYKSDIHIKRRVLPRFKGVKVRDGYFTSVQNDTVKFNNNFDEYYSRCMSVFRVSTPPNVYNCSSNSVVNNFKKISYDEAIKLCQ